MSLENIDPDMYGNRYDTEDKHFQLYKKGIELGTWDPAKLIQKVPLEKDKEVWDSLDRDEKEMWARLLAFFMDGEMEVAQDVHGLLSMASNPHLDNRPEKQAFLTVLALEESKHTEAFSLYINEVMDDVFPDLGRGPRWAGMEVPRTSSCGVSDLFDRQGHLVARAAQPSAGPEDIARAVTTYHLGVEATLARAGYTAKTRMMKEAPLEALDQIFQFVSTDEGRHITNGIVTLQELLEKERQGNPQFVGVDEAIWDQAMKDLWDILDTGYFIIQEPEDPLNADWDDVVDRLGELFVDQYDDQLELESFDYIELIEELQEIQTWLVEKVENDEYQEKLSAHQERYQRAMENIAADGGEVQQ